jgi:hypothetical protein
MIDKLTPDNKITDDQLFEQIAINQRKMSDVLLSYEAEIKRIKFRLDRLEKENNTKKFCK